jgi:regulator of protease activity HflC (stomatin/prohibitin superfamily)
MDTTDIRTPPKPPLPHPIDEPVPEKAVERQEEHGETSTVESLRDALSIGFTVLRVLLLLLAVLFLLSNMYWVPEGYVAVHSRFGALLGSGSRSVRTPGGPYFALPYPLDNVIRIPTTIRHLSVNKAFWLESGAADAQTAQLRDHAFKPGIHGSLLTGDRNIVQGVWTVHYRLAFSPAQTETYGTAIDFLSTAGTPENADRIVLRVAEEVLVREIAGTSVADYVAGRIDHEKMQRHMQRVLDRLGTGLVITSMSVTRNTPPRILTEAFQAVNQAQSRKALEIEKAMRYRVSTLSETAGENWEALLNAVEAFERTTAEGDHSAADSALDQARNLLFTGRIGGSIAQQLDRARTDKTRTIERARAASSRFLELLPAYRRDPAVLKNQLRQDVLKKLWSQPTVETRWIPPYTRLYLNMEGE